MSSFSGTFTATGDNSQVLFVKCGDTFSYTLDVTATESFIGTVILQKSTDGSSNFKTVASWTGTSGVPLEDSVVSATTDKITVQPGEFYRFHCELLDTGESSDNIAYTMTDVANVLKNIKLVNGKFEDEDGNVLIQFKEDQVDIGDGAFTVNVSTGAVNFGASSGTTTQTINATQVDIQTNLDGSGGILSFENTDTGVIADQSLGTVQFYSNDASTDAGGIRAKLTAESQSALGATSFKFYTTAASSTTLVEALEIDESQNVTMNGSAAGANKTITVLNNHTDADSNSALRLITAAAAGDCYTEYEDSGETNKWTVGFDGSDSDNFKICQGNMGTNPYVVIDLTTGIVQVPSGLRHIVVTDDVTDPPTDAELDTAFGAPATVGAGFTGIVNDNGAGTDVWLCYTDGVSWFYLQGTTAA